VSDHEFFDEMDDALGYDFDVLDDLAGTLRLRERPQALFVNCGTGDMISTQFSDEDVACFERLRREALERNRKQFREPPKGEPPAAKGIDVRERSSRPLPHGEGM
jgi:hypothetical protein